MDLKYFLLYLTLFFFIVHARDLPQQPQLGLEANGGAPTDCWDALTEIKSCTNEIVDFFTNGTNELGAPCCNAIKIIAQNCWPTLLTTALGFTADEYNVLFGYCDKAASGLAPSPLVHPLVQAQLKKMMG
ncbi:hypothetical protein LguiB_032558 [Lonicera macranthoides]